MPIGFIRRLARQSFRTTYVPLVDSTPTLQDNWTTQQTTTYNALTPAAGAAAWGGTVANLDRVLTATGLTHTALGLLATFIQKPEAAAGVSGSLAGAVVKVTPTYPAGSAAALELWSLDGVTWTKRRRIPLATICRSGESVVLDLTGPVLGTADVDAYWITLAPDIGTETLTWICCHLYGICPNDPMTPDCPPGTPPEECNAPECGVDIEEWVCLDPPKEPDPAPDPDPFVFPPIVVEIPMAAGTFALGTYFHDCPRPTEIRMFFGDIPGGGSVKVTIANAQGVVFVEGVEQTISVAGTMTWTVSTGYHYANPGVTQALPPSQVSPFISFLFTRQLAGSAFAAVGNLLNILTYFWTYDLAYVEVC